MHSHRGPRPLLRFVVAIGIAILVAATGPAAGRAPSTITRTWTGGGAPSSLWSTAANWSPVGIPVGTERLVFNGSLGSTNMQDLDNGSNSFELRITGNVVLDGSGTIPSCLISTQPYVEPAAPDARPRVLTPTNSNIFPPIHDTPCGASGSVFYLANADDVILYFGGITMTTLTKQGPGTLYIESPPDNSSPRSPRNGFWPSLVITGGTAQVDAPAPALDVALQAGVLAGAGTVGNVTVSSGSVNPDPAPEVPGGPSVHKRPPAVTGAILHTGSVSFNSSTTLSLHINGNTPGTNQDQLAVTGTVSLGNATLNAVFGSVPALGTVFQIVSNDGADPVVGTFNGLPQNGTFVISGPLLGRLSYTGGDGNDVTISVVTDVPVMPHAALFMLGAGVLALGIRRLRAR